MLSTGVGGASGGEPQIEVNSYLTDTQLKPSAIRLPGRCEPNIR